MDNVEGGYILVNVLAIIIRSTYVEAIDFSCQAYE